MCAIDAMDRGPGGIMEVISHEQRDARTVRELNSHVRQISSPRHSESVRARDLVVVLSSASAKC